MPGEFVEPVQLQIVCGRIWNQIPASARSISASHVSTHGDVGDALLEYDEEQVTAVASELELAPRPVRQWFERRFITDDHRRGRVFERDGDVGGQPLAVALRFQKSYLLRSETQGDATWFELAHDRLVTPSCAPT